MGNYRNGPNGANGRLLETNDPNSANGRPLAALVSDGQPFGLEDYKGAVKISIDHIDHCIIALRRGRQRRVCVHNLRRWWWDTESHGPASQDARRRCSRRRRQGNGCC